MVRIAEARREVEQLALEVGDIKLEVAEVKQDVGEVKQDVGDVKELLQLFLQGQPKPAIIAVRCSRHRARPLLALLSCSPTPRC
jgi:DNA polymerase III delta subunit